MDLAHDDAEDAAHEAVAAALAAHCPLERVRKAEPLGFDADLWARLDPVTAPLFRLTELAVAAEETGRRIAPVPFVEVSVARRLLGGLDVADLPLPTLAVRPVEAGLARLVPAGAVASHVVALAGDRLVLVTAPDTAYGLAPPTLGAAPLADHVVGDAVGDVVLATGPDAVARHTRAVDEWRVLTANLLVGIATGAFDLAVERVRTREQFGVPIGTFQAVQHRLADLATEIDGARLLAWESAWASDDGDSRAGVLAAMAFVNAADVAGRVATEALHLHGGLGYTVAGDVQLFFRRAKAIPLVLGDPERELARLGDLLYGPSAVR